jgi:hypothetical protein
LTWIVRRSWRRWRWPRTGPPQPTRDRRPPQVQPPTAEAASLERAADLILTYRSAAQEPAESPAPPHVEIAAATPAADEAAEPAIETPVEPVPTERLIGPSPEAPAQVAWPQSQAETIALEEATREPAAEEIEVGVEPESAASPVPPHAAETTAPVEVADVPAPAAAAPPDPSAIARPVRHSPQGDGGRAKAEAALAPTCARCGQVVAVADLVSGAAGRRGGFLLCAACLPHHPPDTADAIPNSATGLLRESLLELRRIGRRERTSGLSLLRLLAYLAQAAALFSGLVMALVSTDRAIYLQAAIFLQLLVLTLLLLERRL